MSVSTSIKRQNLKAVITNDIILINRKNKTPIAYQFRGFMVQCVNDTPRFRDKSGSLYRRQLIIPFNKSFTGAERKYIKQDYMHRTEVLEYVLHRVLSGSFYELSEPAAVKMALHQYKIENDPCTRVCRRVPRVVWSGIYFRGDSSTRSIARGLPRTSRLIHRWGTTSSSTLDTCAPRHAR